MNAVITTGREYLYPEDVRLISTTDTRGIITYANPEFCEVAGFSPDELIGRQHSIVRHPDMPSAAFEDMWNHLKNDHPWMGMVKNRRKDGDHYWVQAYVMPLYDQQGSKTGYQSVRTRPTQAQIEHAESTYQKINKSPPKRLKTSSLAQQIMLLLAGMGVLLFAIPLLPLSSPLQTGLMALTLILFLAAAYFLTRKLNGITQTTQTVYNNPLAQLVMTQSMTEPGSVELATRMMRARLRTVIGRVEDSVTTLGEVMSETDTALRQTTEGIRQQNSESDMLASAATEMSATAHEIARNTSETSAATQHASQLAEEGKRSIHIMRDSIDQLVQNVQTASSSSAELKHQATAIEQIVNMINEIAEQTNLLALNAAIEAARAGEQGRGFAVVADEVRTLAQRTQSSTSEIRATIDTIQRQVSLTAETMQRCSEQAQQGITLANGASQAFEEVTQAMQGVSDRCIQVASASEQQSSVSDEISQNILNIRNIANNNMSAAEQTTQASQTLHQLVADLRSTIKSFSA